MWVATSSGRGRWRWASVRFLRSEGAIRFLWRRPQQRTDLDAPMLFVRIPQPVQTGENVPPLPEASIDKFPVIFAPAASNLEMRSRIVTLCCCVIFVRVLIILLLDARCSRFLNPKLVTKICGYGGNSYQRGSIICFSVEKRASKTSPC